MSVLPTVHTEAEADQLSQRREQQAASERETREHRERECARGKPGRATAGPGAPAAAPAASPGARARGGRFPVPLLHAW